MPVSPFADAQPPEATPGGDSATPTLDPPNAAATGGGPGNAGEPVKQASPARSGAGEEELEHGWTGLGLPAYEEPAPKPAAPIAKEIAAPPKEPAPPAEQAPAATAPSAIADPIAPAPVVEAAPPAPIAEPAPKPLAKEAAPVAKPPAPPPRPAMGPPRPTGRSGTFPAAPRISKPSPEPVLARPQAPPEPPPRLAAPSPEPLLARPSAAAPEPPPRLSAPSPAPAPRAHEMSPTGTLRDPVRFDALGPELLGPPPSERDITVEDEGDLGATIPETSLPFEQDLTATVPNLPPPAQAPSFGLPPAMPSGPMAPPPMGHAAIAPPPMGSASDPLSASGASPPYRPKPQLADTTEDVETGPPPYGEGALIGDKYRLIRVIGRGGMGAVWVAHNTSLDVDVAIKLMRRDRATPEAAARFTTEARAAARLGHPSIVRVFDFGETSRGDPFIVMELLHGESFGALLTRKKKLSPNVAVQTLLPVAHALSAAHAKGIVHRDLKPDNILLAKDESNVVTPKLVDFGIAKLMTNDVDRHFTIAGEVLGSPDYMSPEQARGEDDIDHRSDIWTFSVLLYEALTGKRPFEGSNYNALLASIIASRPAPIMDLGVGDPVLWSILEKGLSKERDDRWQSAREMGMELARWAIDHGADHDLVGSSLAAQWLEPLRKRLFTVAGSPPPEGSTAQAADVAIPKPPPLGGLVGEVPKPTGPATATTLPPFVPRRRPWVTILVLAVIASGIAFALVYFGFFDAPVSTATPSADPTATAAPSTTTTESPSTTTSAAAPPTSAKPATSAKTRPTATAAPTKGHAPQVKGNIKF